MCSSVPVTEGDELFLVVESHSSADAGDFVLRAWTRELDVCGDGYRDPNEGCDDENLLSEDGCSTACELEPTEIEPNGTAGDATLYEDGFVGEVADADDEDLVRIELPSGKVQHHGRAPRVRLGLRSLLARQRARARLRRRADAARLRRRLGGRLLFAARRSGSRRRELLRQGSRRRRRRDTLSLSLEGDRQSLRRRRPRPGRRVRRRRHRQRRRLQRDLRDRVGELNPRERTARRAGC